MNETFAWPWSGFDSLPLLGAGQVTAGQGGLFVQGQPVLPQI
jgi:hypothetical protein